MIIASQFVLCKSLLQLYSGARFAAARVLLWQLAIMCA